MNLNNVADKSFFILVEQLVGSTSVESTLLWRLNIPLLKKIKKLKKKGDLLTICQETCQFSSSKTKSTLKRKETFKQESDEVADIEPPTPFDRE